MTSNGSRLGKTLILGVFAVVLGVPEQLEQRTYMLRGLNSGSGL